ncbi:MAG: octanoyltransferase, partial [bacterium]
VQRGRSFHGLSLNVDLDPAPFAMIHPCGYRDLQVIRTLDLGIDATLEEIAHRFRLHFENLLAANHE